MVSTVGFIGLGRLGSPVARLLLESRYRVVCCARGRTADLVAMGAEIAGDGSPRAVAEAAPVLITCLPASTLPEVFTGADGILAAAGPLPLVLELSTAPEEMKHSLRQQLHERGGDLLDCPVSGTPTMVADRAAVVYASGDRSSYERVAGILSTISPRCAYVGLLGQGMRMKYVANLLAVVNAATTAEAMAFAARLGLDLDQVVKLVTGSPAATSGQFAIRAPLIAAGQFDGRLVTVRDVRENLAQIASAAHLVQLDLPLAQVARRTFEALGEAGEDESDPAKLAWYLDQHPRRTRDG